MLSTGTSFSGWMQAEQLTWHYDGKTIELGADWSGQGPLVLLFALSSISTRREMRPLQERLCAHYQTVAAEFSKPHGTSRGFSSRNAPQLYLFQCGLELFE
jgi:hypothetical protein